MSRGTAKREITTESFAAFLHWLDPDEEVAGLAYERLRFRLITYFSGRNCLHPDELADETINRVCLRIGSEIVENKMAYVYGFARNVLREEIRSRRTFVEIGDTEFPAAEAESDDAPHECLERCLNELPEDSRGLVLTYFSEAKKAKIDLHKSMATAFGMSQTALRMRIVRIKQRLRLCIEGCESMV